MEPVTTAALIYGGSQVLGNLLGGMGASDAAKASAQAQERMLERQIAEQRAAYGDVAPLFQQYGQAGNAGLAQLLGLDPLQYQTELGQFQFDGDVMDYLDPSMAFQQEQARKAIEQSGVASGLYGSGGTLKALQDRSMQLAQTDYGNAFNRMQTDRNFAYKQFLDDFTNRRANAADLYGRQLNLGSLLTNVGQSAATGQANARMGVGSNISNAMGATAPALARSAEVQAAAPYATGQNILQGLTNKDMMGFYGDIFNQGNQGTGGL